MVAQRRLVIRDLRSSRATEQLIYNAAHSPYRTGLGLVLANTEPIFPRGAVSFAAALQYLKSVGYPIQIESASDRVRDAKVLTPQKAATFDPTKQRVTNVVWEYCSVVEANLLTNEFTRAIEDNVRCEAGVIDALTWCLFEVLDNVFQHSRAECGYVMMQLHPKSRRCAIAVSDTGIGVHKSFVEAGVYRADTAYDALKLAVQERVTSKSKNMGNGLYGLIRVVGLNGGSLSIQSGRGILDFRDGKLDGSASPTRPVLEPEFHQGTTVDWQLNTAAQVRLSDALNMPYPADSRLEKIEDEEGEHRLLVREFEEGIGSRTSAASIRLRLVNYLADGVPKLVLDFDGLNVVSSSFADEVLGKFVLEFGEKCYNERFRLDRATPTVRAIIARAIRQRVEEGDENFPARAGA